MLLCTPTYLRGVGMIDKNKPTVCGMGIVGYKYGVTNGDGIHCAEYVYWKSMLNRCNSKLYKSRRPTYEVCTISENFKHYEYFYEWCNKQIGFSVNDFQLDKDLLVKGNKIYSEETCLFLPKEVNTLLSVKKSQRGSCVIGVTFNKRESKFKSQMSKFGNKLSLGTYTTEIQAFNAYKLAKEAYLKEIAEKYKSQIDLRAYDALMNYTVNIDD